MSALDPTWMNPSVDNDSLYNNGLDRDKGEVEDDGVDNVSINISPMRKYKSMRRLMNRAGPELDEIQAKHGVSIDIDDSNPMFKSSKTKRGK